ncbi:MAG: ATP-dependent DNA ligase [Candidatus Altiarchaeota archaeon]|nr:ATP-dependent DNA ligase [Candidatus Altiarchaeota archaeon]
MFYKELAEYFIRLEGTASNIEKADILAELFSKTPANLLKTIAYFTKGDVFPPWMNREINVGDKTVIAAISRATGASKQEIAELLRLKGDLGSVAATLMAKRKQKALFSEPLTVEKIHKTLEKIEGLEGAGSVDAKISSIAELIGNSSPEEARYIVRIALGQLRMGVGEGIIRDAIAKAFKVEVALVENAQSLLNDYGEVATLAALGNNHLRAVKMKMGRPIKVMLYPKAENLTEVFEKIGTPVQLEYKYDGFRTQIHKSKDGKIKIFTRRLDDVTHQFPDIVAAIEKQVIADEFVIDSETVGIDSLHKDFVPFQKISQRIRRKYEIQKMVEQLPVNVYIFDLLYLNGKKLLDLPLSQRFERAKKIIAPGEKVHILSHLVTDDILQAEKFYQKALDSGVEGLIVKDPSSVYKPGHRVGYGFKIKPEVESLDLVIIGAEWGEGRRTNWLSSFVLAIRGPNNEFLPVGKLGTGMTDQDLEKMTQALKPDELQGQGKTIKLKPKMVVEVGYQEIQKSTNYSSGFALRFPRLVRIRDDRGPSDADSLTRLEVLYGKQFSKFRNQ